VDFVEGVPDISDSPSYHYSTKDILQLLLLNYSLSQLPPDSHPLLQPVQEMVSWLVRDQLIPITDAWDFSDTSLNSAVGCREGGMYQHLFERALKEPLNSTRRKEAREVFLDTMQHLINPTGDIESHPLIQDERDQLQRSLQSKL